MSVQCKFQVSTYKTTDLAILGQMGQIFGQTKQLFPDLTSQSFITLKMSVQFEFQVSTFKITDLAILSQMGQIWAKFVAKRGDFFQI